MRNSFIPGQVFMPRARMMSNWNELDHSLLNPFSTVAKMVQNIDCEEVFQEIGYDAYQLLHY